MPDAGLDVSFEDLGHVRERRRQLAADVAEAKAWSKAHWQEEPRAAAYVRRLRALVDFGFVTEAYELSETLLASVPGPFAGRRIVQAYMAHAETARKLKLPKQREFYASLKESALPLERGHGAAGLSLIALLEGNFDGARDDIRFAKQAFEDAGEPLDVWKMDIREIMLLRFADDYAAASKACQRILAACAAMKPSERTEAAAIRISLLATLASNALETGNLSEALRVLKGAARLARALPEAQASVYALSQYGNALQKAGRHEEAIAWLEEASSRQRVVEPAAYLNTQSILLGCFLASRRWTPALALAQEMLASRMHGVDPELRAEIEAHVCALQASLFLVDDDAGLVRPESMAEGPEGARAREAFSEAKARLAQAQVVGGSAPAGPTPAHAGSRGAAARLPRLVWDKDDERVIVHQSDGGVQEHDARAGTALVGALERLVESAPGRVDLSTLFPALAGEHPRSTARRRQRAVKALVEDIGCAERVGPDALTLRSAFSVFVLPSKQACGQTCGQKNGQTHAQTLPLPASIPPFPVQEVTS